MLATGVTYASELNLAASTFGVDQAILQSIIDVVADPTNLTMLPSDAQDYARRYAAAKGKADSNNDNGMQWPEANIMACGWCLVRFYQVYGDQWTAVKAHFGMSPSGEALMRKIFFSYYPKYQKAWKGLS